MFALLPLLTLVSSTLAGPRLLNFRPFMPVPDVPHDCTHDRRHSDAAADFLILGAGMSGLAAAHYLHAQTVNCTIRILEATALPGGRVHTHHSGPFKGIEKGAGWIHDYQNHPMLAVAHWAGIRTQFVGGNSSYIGGENIRVFDGNEELTPVERLHSDTLIKALLYGVDVHVEGRKYHGHPDMPVLDSMRHLAPAFDLADDDKRMLRWHVDVIFGGDWAAPLGNMSLMNMEHGSLANEGGDCVFPDGFGQVPGALADGLDIQYNTVARSIRWSSDGTDVYDANNKKWSGRRLLVTPSIGVLRSGDLQFQPSLPQWKTDAIEKVEMASLNRIMLRFPRPFWPDNTYTFGFLPGPVRPDRDWLLEPVFSIAVVASSEGRHSEDGSAILTFMVGGDSATTILQQSKDKIVAHLMHLLRDAFGSNVPDPTDSRIAGWADEPYARGAYSYLPVGTSATDDVPILYRPLNHTLFFAGEATMTGSDRGTTHGAFLSGIREAARMLGHQSVVEDIEQGDDVVLPHQYGRSSDSRVKGLMVDGWFRPESLADWDWLQCGPPQRPDQKSKLVVQN
ncbi:hypothetical protein EXIGLDRAFT_693084 [Exidia glandulosa HHB12029]|uniref:Amine oxidase n=1 Tax=Exidia glandulosa HHB12029 TaxID=1314781 RepID=A0A165HJ24_EXIGL|nr:hypothetical protein EXIGLDRAFT_693084 [Exidia glandulosa HHB12029]